jgi:hypothetical protein
MSEPYEQWVATGVLSSSDAYIGCVERDDGSAIEYALFGVDPERDDDAPKDWGEFVTDDLEGCECQRVRVAVVRTDEGSIEAKDQWHSDEDCSANVRQTKS